MRQTENDKNRQQQSIDKNSVFSISPCSGEFQPDGSFEFGVMSSPTEVYVRWVDMIPTLKQYSDYSSRNHPPEQRSLFRHVSPLAIYGLAYQKVNFKDNYSL
jgi:hypothetical protein